MKKARLQKVVDHLRKVRVLEALDKAPEFDLESWGVLERQGVFKGKKDLSCMTSACAIGHAAHLFKSQGFKLVLDGMENRSVIPYYKGHEQFFAVAAFFEITYKEAEYLFHPGEYAVQPTPVGMVADRIEDFIHGIDRLEE